MLAESPSIHMTAYIAALSFDSYALFKSRTGL